MRSDAPRPRASYAAFVALGILLSRIAGLVRDRVFAHYLGNSPAAGAFRAALRIPNFLQNLFGEGVLSASFIPVYSRLLASGETELAGKVAGAVASILAAAVTVLTALGVLLTPWLVDLIVPGFEGEVRALTVDLVRILFPGVGLLVLSAWCLGVLNSHRRFFLPYVAPVLWNVALIVALIARGGQVEDSRLVTDLAWASVVGSAFQFGVQLPFVLRLVTQIRFGFQSELPAVREVFRHFGTVFVSRGVVQISAYVDGIIASFLGAGAVASLAYAQTIYLLPIGLFGMSVAAAELPEMSRESVLGGTDASGAAARAEALQARIQAGRRRIGFFVIPSFVALAFLGKFIVSALYQTGKFGDQDTLYVAYILVGSALGILAATWGRLYSSAYYAWGDTKTPLRFAILRVVLTAAMGWLFAFPLRPALIGLLFGEEGLALPLPTLPGIELGLGAVGIAFASSLAGWVEYLGLRFGMEKRVGSTRIPLGFHVGVWGAALPAAALAFLFDREAYDALTGGVPIDAFSYDLRPLIVLGVYGVIFLGLSSLFGVRESHAIFSRVGSRFRR